MASKQNDLTLTAPALSEHQEQSDLLLRCYRALDQYPDLLCLFAVPNGGFRNYTVAKQLAAEGSKPGVPDLVFPMARGGYFGYYQEQKVRGNSPDKRQKAWHKLLRSLGYKVDVSYGAEAGWFDLLAYYRLPPTPLPADCPVLTPAERLECFLAMLPDWAVKQNYGYSLQQAFRG